jgi:hypothetical protein
MATTRCMSRTRRPSSSSRRRSPATVRPPTVSSIADIHQAQAATVGRRDGRSDGAAALRAPVLQPSQPGAPGKPVAFKEAWKEFSPYRNQTIGLTLLISQEGPIALRHHPRYADDPSSLVPSSGPSWCQTRQALAPRMRPGAGLDTRKCEKDAAPHADDGELNSDLLASPGDDWITENGSSQDPHGSSLRRASRPLPPRPVG